VRRVVFATALGLAACAAPPPYDLDPGPLPPAPPAAPPDVAPIADGWYPVDPASVALLAGERGIAMREQEARLEAAAAAERQAERALWPSLQPRLLFQTYDGRIQDTAGQFLDVDKQSLAAGAGVVLSLDVVEARVRLLAARRRAEAAREGSEAARRATALEGLERYEDLVAAQGELAIAREVLAGATAVADAERARARADAALRADLLRAEAQEEAARGAVVKAEARFREASARLAAALRIDPRTTLFASEARAEPIDLVEDGTALDDLIVEATAARPELAEAALLVEAAELEERAARVAPWAPRVVAGYGADGFGPNFDDLDDREQFAVGLEWTLSFERFGRKDEVRARTHAAEVASVRRREEIVEAVVRNREAARAATAGIESARRRVEASEEALHLVQKRQEGGAALLVEVLIAQRDLALARRDLLSAVLAQNRAERRLYFALGRGADAAASGGPRPPPSAPGTAGLLPTSARTSRIRASILVASTPFSAKTCFAPQGSTPMRNRACS
jgi:multidrug efflux system outer membrane protein